MHVIVEDGAVVAELSGWNPAAVAAMLHARGHNISPPSVPPPGALALGPLTALPATDVRPTPGDDEKITSRGWMLHADRAEAVYVLSPKTDADRCEEARAALAATDAEFDPRWLEDILAGTPHQRMLEWQARREALRLIARG